MNDKHDTFSVNEKHEKHHKKSGRKRKHKKRKSHKKEKKAAATTADVATTACLDETHDRRSTKRFARQVLPDTSARYERDLSTKYAMEPKVSASKRCVDWVMTLPKKNNWSMGTTQSTMTIHGLQKHHKQRPIQSTTAFQNLKRKRMIQRTLDRDAYKKALRKYRQTKKPMVSARNKRGRMPQISGQHCKRTYSCQVRQLQNRALKNMYHLNSMIKRNSRHRTEDYRRMCRKYGRRKSECAKYGMYDDNCRQCLKEKWASKLARTNRNPEYVYERKHRTGHFLSSVRDKASLGWAILQVIKRIGKRRAFPLAILMELRRKWGLRSLNIIELNDALAWMEKRNLITSKVRMNREYPKYSPDPRGEARLLCKLKRSITDEKLCRLQNRTPRMLYKTRDPNCVSIKTKWREQLRRKH